MRNSKALGAALDASGVKALYKDLGYSESHTILIETEHAEAAVAVLDNAGLSVDALELPWNHDGVATGLRRDVAHATNRTHQLWCRNLPVLTSPSGQRAARDEGSAYGEG